MTWNRIATVAVAALVALAPATALRATPCSPDAAPSASLLIPLFEVDLDRCSSFEGPVPVLLVSNALPTPVLAGITLWSDWGVPVTGFQVYLPGYASQPVNLADVVCKGTVPQTGAGVSPHGPSSDPPVHFLNCNDSPAPGGAPNYAQPMPPSLLSHVVTSLTGEPSTLDGRFRGEYYGDGVVRGFITVDTLNACHLLLPDAPGYFGPGGTGIAANTNALLGELLVVDPTENFAYAFPAAHLEAAALFAPGDLTFYGAKGGLPDWVATDAREPLPTTFAATYAAGQDDASSSVIAWRERTGEATGSPGPFQPLPLPLDHLSIVAFDEAAHAQSSYVPPVLPGDPGLVLVSYPLVTARYPGEAGSPFASGWRFLNLQTFQGPPGGAGQSWVLTMRWWEGRFSTGVTAAALDSSCVDTGGTPLSVPVTPSGGLAADPHTPWIFWADFEDALAGWSGLAGAP